VQDRIPLADLLAHISDELFAADAAAKKRGKAAMQFKECELEFAVSAEVKADADIKVWVINLGAGAKNTHSNKMKIKFERNPQSAIQAAHKTGTDVGPTLTRQRKSN
jgi:hypothetical protein